MVISGPVWSGASSGGPHAGAVAVREGKIVAVGPLEEVLRHADGRTELIDASGGLVLPGFADGHTHFVDGGFQLTAIDLRDAATPKEFVRRVAAYVRTRPAGEWVRGGNWDHERWRGAPLPRRSWIDSVTPDHPVLLYRLDGHMALANGVALRAAHITRETPQPDGGEILRDPRSGDPLGILKDRAIDMVEAVVPAPSPERRDSALAVALRHAASLGVTATAHMSASFADLASYRRLERAGRLTLRVYLYLPIAEWSAAADTVAGAGSGDAWVHVAGVKAYVDGSAGARTAAFFAPYSDSAGYAGLFRRPAAELRNLLGAADSAGLQLAVHAIGDRANALVLDVFDSLAEVHGQRDRRFRIEHAQHLRSQDISRFAAIPAIASMQPYHAIDDGRWIEKRIGVARAQTSYAFRSLLDAGARLAFGSDWTVAPLDPLTGIYAAVTRRTLDGKHPDGWVPEQRIALGDALRAYTAGNAWAVFAEHRWGTLAPGYDADVVVLDRNLFALPPESLATAKVRYTIVGGKVVYRAAVNRSR